MSQMVCRDCGLIVEQAMEKAIGSGEWAAVWKDGRGDWTCPRTGNEHRAEPYRSTIDKFLALNNSVHTAITMWEDGEISGDEAMNILAVEVGLKERSEESKQLGEIIRQVADGKLPASVLTAYLDESFENAIQASIEKSATVEVRVTLDVDGDPQEMAQLLAEYLTSNESAFCEDYSYDAGGGYQGPWVRSVTVALPDETVVSSENWPTERGEG